jgi:hypothetical protein
MPGRIGFIGAGVGEAIVTTSRSPAQHAGTGGRVVVGGVDGVAVVMRGAGVAARRRASSASSWKKTTLIGMNPASVST